MIPQPEVQDSTGSTALLDSHLGYGFALIAVDCPALDLASTLRHDYWQVLGVKVIHVFSAVQRPLRDACLMLLDDRFREVVRQHTGEVLLVRPDRYVAAVTSPHDLDTLAQKIEHLLRLGGETPAL
jgi:3-(3-hydroxy-phenyl)propionate hydroxylase